MLKSTASLLVVVENPQIWRTLARVSAGSHHILRASSESDVRQHLAEAGPISMVLVEPLIGHLSGLKMLDLTRDIQPQAFRVVISNFSEISLLIEGVHNGIVQRVLGLPLIDAEIRSLLTATTMMGSATHPPIPSFVSRPAIVAAH